MCRWASAVRDSHVGLSATRVHGCEGGVGAVGARVAYLTAASPYDSQFRALKVLLRSPGLLCPVLAIDKRGMAARKSAFKIFVFFVSWSNLWRQMVGTVWVKSERELAKTRTVLVGDDGSGSMVL